jgi:hypothetical protein
MRFVNSKRLADSTQIIDFPTEPHPTDRFSDVGARATIVACCPETVLSEAGLDALLGKQIFNDSERPRD